MKSAVCACSALFAAVGLLSGPTKAATQVRGGQLSWAAGEIPQSSTQRLDLWTDSVRRQHDIPGLAVIVFRADTVLALGIAGVRRSNSTAPIEERDRFQLGSNSKAITAAVLATLVEEGKLAWTSTLADIFAERRDSISEGF